eukprot:6213873-Pleurochrysis_carterae.AAC.3
MQAAVRTREIDACESLIDLEALSQRPAALVADAAAICMHRAALAMAAVRTRELDSCDRTRKIDACESLVDLQTLSQRLAACVADANAPCMQTAPLRIVQRCRGASNDAQAHDQYISSRVWPCKQRCVRERLIDVSA